MSLSITRNNNGTITVACGNDSITIGDPAAANAPPNPQQPAWVDPYILPDNNGTAASIVWRGQAKTEIVSVPSVDDLPRLVRKMHDLHAPAQKPTIFQFHVKADKALNIETFNKAISDVGNPDWMGAEIKLMGLDDE